MKPDRAWVRLGSGQRLDLINPQPGDWTRAPYCEEHARKAYMRAPNRPLEGSDTMRQ
jgi:hypothetical protein